MKKSILLASLAFAASLQLGSAADITGKVTLKGTPPPEKPLDVIKENAGCAALIKDVPKTRFYVVGANGELADVVVSLKGVPAKSTGAQAEPVLLDQVKCEYVPYFAAVQTGQKILVRNSDPLMHNVHPTPTVAGNKEVNKVQMAKAKDLEFTFDNAEKFLRYKCDVHPWMISYVSVFDHPYFAMTGKDGTFTIKNVPAGKYTVEAAHRKGGVVTKEIEVKDSGVTADFEIPVPEVK